MTASRSKRLAPLLVEAKRAQNPGWHLMAGLKAQPNLPKLWCRARPNFGRSFDDVLQALARMQEIRRYAFGACMWCVVVWLHWFPWKFKHRFGFFGTAIVEGPGAYVAPFAVRHLEAWSGLEERWGGEPNVRSERNWSLAFASLIANVAFVYVGVPVFRAVVLTSKSPCVEEGRLLCRGLEFDAQKGISFAFASLLPFWATILWIASTRIKVISAQFLEGVLIGVIPGSMLSMLTISLGMMVHWYQWRWILHGIVLLVKGACTGMLCFRMEDYLAGKSPPTM